jgi:predicted outer membrane repeat protein
MNLATPSGSPFGDLNTADDISRNDIHRLPIDSLNAGGNMHRLVKALLLLAAFVLIGETALSQALPIVQVRGRLPQGQLQVFTKDKLYQITGEYYVAGTLLIEPGTTVEFLPNGRLIDSVGGRIMADGELDAIWNRNTGAVTSYPNGYCDVGYMKATVTPSVRPDLSITAPTMPWQSYVPWLLFYYANGLDRCTTDPNKKNTPYLRDVARAPITFRGRPVTQFSPEWGHIVILPGADSAIFRNCTFVNFRKESRAITTTDFYSPNSQVGYNQAQINAGVAMNVTMRNLTSGGGGAMTVFSSKTWILNCRFDSNYARYHGGAVQFLQAPFDPNGTFYTRNPAYPNPSNNPFFYPAADPETFDLYGGVTNTPIGPITSFTATNPAGPTAQYRQAYDDGRIAINLGRVRRATFRDNRAIVSNATSNTSGYFENTTVVTVTGGGPNSVTKDEAYGGAIYISGRRHITVNFGRALGDPTDSIICERNHAVNYQNAAGTNGAKGGAIFVGDSSSMTFQLARFVDNFTAVPNVPATNFVQRGLLSQGGGIYMSSTSPQIAMRGNVLFRNNNAGQGGGLYVAAVASPTADPFISPNLIGDSVYFYSNKAEYDGGAIYTQRNMSIEANYVTRVDSAAPGLPLVDRRIVLDSNVAGLAGGAIVIDYQGNPTNSNARIEKVLFSHNSVGDSARVKLPRLIKLYDPVQAPFGPGKEFGTFTVLDSFNLGTNITALSQQVLGGGAIYSVNGNTNFFRSVEFQRNRAVGGNGGAISMITPVRTNRYFLSAGDSAYDFSIGSPTAFSAGPEPTDQRQMTRFLANSATNDLVAPTLNRNPHSQTGFTSTLFDPNRNGTGLGGAIYINDLQPSGGGPGTPRTDSVILHRVRMERDTAYSGSAVYSDNYQLRVILNKNLVANNIAYSPVGRNVDTIQNYVLSPASSRVAAATFYGDIEGPTPTELYHTNANSIYDNDARFLVRLPDAPAGSAGFGQSGVDTLRGNFWGETQAPVTTVLPTGTQQNTFYVQGLGCTLPLKNPAIPNQQGPFESARMPGEPSNILYSYTPVPVGQILDTLLMEGRIYDIFDKGLDIKAADYSNPRLAPIEDFAVGIPKRLRTYANGVYAGKVVRRLTRDPFVADADTTAAGLPGPYAQLQREFVGNHPIGYPLFLESRANYLGNPDTSNNDAYALNQTVFFVINVETGEFIRTTLRQIAEGSDVYRSRVEFVPDSVTRDPLARRTREGRAGFSVGELYRLAPRYYFEQDPTLQFNIPASPTRLDSVKYARRRAAEYEDSVAVSGRRYGGFVNQLGGNGFAYTNRVNPITFADVYAGERYHALPVKTGDRVWVISRTDLWNMTDSLGKVQADARARGLQFTIDTIGNSVMAPVVYGQRDSLERKSPAELRNTRFLTEDKNYASDPTGANESQIFEVTATDVNGFFDPRSLYFPKLYTGLRYEWSPLQEFPATNFTVPTRDPKLVRLASWLKTDTVFPFFNQSSRDSAHARGFLRFYGQPHNPDVVPGGELLEIKVSNYPPGIRTIDSLKGLVSADTVARYIFLYPPYFNCQVYDPLTARYLQQDTVDVGGASTTTYRLRIFVQDTPPNLSDARRCVDGKGQPIANLTNALRFDFDVNSDDETEDQNAQTREGWDFRYGRTTYGWVFTDRPNLDVHDTTVHDDVKEIRPTWLADRFLLDSTTMQTDNGVSFLKSGKITIRMNRDTALNLLRNPAQANGAYNLDTIFTVVANDGHTGQAKRDLRVTVNVAPQLQGIAGIFKLPNAKEDFDYNPQMRDLARRIQASDLNLGQRVRYRLVYKDGSPNQDPQDATGQSQIDSDGTVRTNTPNIAYVRRDACYQEAGLFQASKTTPDWLKINPISGMLYGTPGLNDAPHTLAFNNPDTVTVVAIDEGGLTDVKTYILEVDSTNHRPHLLGRPPIQCVEAGKAYLDTICLSDFDLGRKVPFNEQITLQVLSPVGVFQINPPVVNGQSADTICGIQITAASIPDSLAGKKVTITILARDAAGNTDTLRYQIAVSEKVDFSMPIWVYNTNTERGNAFQRLEFGIARNATTGDEPNNQGNLDINYCEYELPPLPPEDVFDARWTIVTKNGILRNIFPTLPSADQGIIAWKGTFQPGFIEGGSPNYPVKICWSLSKAQAAPKQIELRDQSEALFNVDMKTGNYRANSGIVVRKITADSICVEISLTSIRGFKIVYGAVGDVKDEPTTGIANAYMLSPNVPNPFASSTEISYYAPKSGDVRIDIYDIHGALVRTLLNGQVEAGSHTIDWNGTDAKGSNVASGTYTYRLTAGSTVLTRTMVLMK